MLEQQIFTTVTQRHGPQWFLGSKESMNKNFHVPEEPISFSAWPGFGSKGPFTAGLDQNKWKLPTLVVGKRRGAVNITLPLSPLSSWQLAVNSLFPKLCFWQWQEKGKLTCVKGNWSTFLLSPNMRHKIERCQVLKEMFFLVQEHGGGTVELIATGWEIS